MAAQCRAPNHHQYLGVRLILVTPYLVENISLILIKCNHYVRTLERDTIIKMKLLSRSYMDACRAVPLFVTVTYTCSNGAIYN